MGMCEKGINGSAIAPFGCLRSPVGRQQNNQRHAYRLTIAHANSMVTTVQYVPGRSLRLSQTPHEGFSKLPESN